MIHKYFLPFCGCLFTFFIVFFAAQVFQIWMKSRVSIFALVLCAFAVRSHKSLPKQGHKDLHLCFLMSFMGLAPIFRAVIHLLLIFVHRMR